MSPPTQARVWLSAAIFGALAGPAPARAAAPPPPGTMQGAWIVPARSAARAAVRPAPPDPAAGPVEAAPGGASVAAPGRTRRAAFALADGDFLGAIAASVALAPAPRGADEVRLLAIRGRASARLGRWRDAVAHLEAALSADPRGQAVPREVLLHELARARLDGAEDRDLPPAAADELRRQAARELGEVARTRGYFARRLARVERARALSAIDGGDDRGRKKAARRAEKELARVLKDFPNLPATPELRLLRAEAMVRAGQLRAGAVELRALYLEWAGEPESDRAWARLGELAASSRKVDRRPLTRAERLTYARNARRLRRVDASRRVLDGLLAEVGARSPMRPALLRERAYTAYRQRDYARCAGDLRELYARTASVRADLLRCLERAHQYDEGLAIHLELARTRRGASRAGALWDATELAFRAGQYARTLELLGRYENLSRGHAQRRRWLRAFAAMRLGRDADAAQAFAAYEARASGEAARRARYFRGKVLLRSPDEARREEGRTLLRDVVESDLLGYYGLWARRRLADAGVLLPVPGTASPAMPYGTRAPIPRGVGLDALARLDARFGAAFPALARARALAEIGYMEEAGYELRRAAETYLSGRARLSGSRFYQPRSEAVAVGLSWEPTFRTPKLRPGKEGRAVLRDAERSAALREDLRLATGGLAEPYYRARLTPSAGDALRTRWKPRAYPRAIEREAAAWGLAPEHLWALMYTESRFRRHVVSPVGARGALQIMPNTARQLAERLGVIEPGERHDPDRLYDIDYNARLAAYYVAELAAKFQGQLPLVYASYNGGPNSVARWVVAKSSRPLELDDLVEEIPFRETYRYVRRVMETHAQYMLLDHGVLPQWRQAVDPRVGRNIDF